MPTANPSRSIEKNIVLITISGEDQAGVTTKVAHVLEQYDANILDIGQAVIHRTLSLGVLAALSIKHPLAQVMEELDTLARSYGETIRYELITESKYEAWVQEQGKARYIVTLLSREITALQLRAVTEVIAKHGLNIEDIRRLSGRLSLREVDEKSRASVEFLVRGQLSSVEMMRSDLLSLSQALGIDLAFQTDNAYRRNRRLVAFDMDSTLIEAEVIDELAKAAGVGEQVMAITEAAMRGEIDFNDSFKQRVALLKGLDASVLETIAQALPITEGAERLISTLRHLGYKTAILSGGFTYFGQFLQKKLGIDFVHANELEIKEGKVTGNVVGTVVNGERKAELLRSIAVQEGLRLEQVIAVGDGANDLPMLAIAGLGIAFRAKPIVRQSAQHAITTLGLDAILYLLGVSDRDQFDFNC